jgi:hypothetical protein
MGTYGKNIRVMAIFEQGLCVDSGTVDRNWSIG